MVALSGVSFAHHDHRTLRHLISVCGDFLKNEFTAMTFKSREDLKHKSKQSVASTDQKFLDKLQKNFMKMVNVFKMVGDMFSICCNHMC
jgi:hypothetical protein